MDMTQKYLEPQVTPQIAPQVGTLKLSAAIRIGARLRPRQCTLVYWSGSDASCAIGAALEAIGHPMDDTMGITETIFRSWPSAPLNEIFRRNDSGQSREQIADLLEAQGY